MFMTYIGTFGSIVGRKEANTHFGSLLVSYKSIMDFIEEISSFMNLLTLLCSMTHAKCKIFLYWVLVMMYE